MDSPSTVTNRSSTSWNSTSSGETGSSVGHQYTSKEYFDLTQLYHITPSMSSPGCPYDNAAMENFFGTLKCECLNRMRFSNRDEVEAAVAEYMQFYNFERINMKNGLTPDEIRSKAA